MAEILGGWFTEEFVGLISVIFNLNVFFLWNPGVLRDFWNWESLRWGKAQCPQLFHRKPPPEAWKRDYSTNSSWNEMGIIMFLNRYNRIKLAKQDINTYPLDRRFRYAIFAVLSLEFLSLSLSEEKKNQSDHCRYVSPLKGVDKLSLIHICFHTLT